MKFPFYSPLRVAEAVGRGHPDRIADQLADKTVDLILEQDPLASIGIEVLLSQEQITIAGEVDSQTIPQLEEGLRQVLLDVGIHQPIPFLFHLHTPSVEISRAVLDGAFADQAIVTGFACREHPSYLPLPQALALEAIKILENIEGLGKDGKLLCFVENETIKELRISWQMEENGPSVEELRRVFFSKLTHLNKQSIIVFHPFFKGGIEADTGLTGRKLVATGYGSEIPHGGGALSGKDGGKVDRLGAYLARLLAKSIVKTEGREWAFVTLSFIFGEQQNHSFDVLTENGSEKRVFKTTKAEIFSLLELQKPRYYETAVKGHFSGDFPWESLTLLP